MASQFGEQPWQLILIQSLAPPAEIKSGKGGNDP